MMLYISLLSGLEDGKTGTYPEQICASQRSLSAYNFFLKTSRYCLVIPASLYYLRLNCSVLSRLHFLFRFWFKFNIAMASYTKSYLIFLSRGESVAKDAKLLTSISQGLTLSSRKMSSPKISKHIEFSRSSGCRDLYECWSYG